MTWIDDHAVLLLRICLVVLFPFSAIDKVVNWGAAMRQASAVPFAAGVLVVGIVVELVCPACIVTGWHDRLAAFTLAGFCAVTALLFHQFWRDPNFWRFKTGEGLSHFWDFLKNFGLVGGLGLIVLAAHAQPLSTVARDPLASSYVVGPAAGDPVPR